MEIFQIGDTVDLLGESCVWSVEENSLYWVDVRTPALRRHDPSEGKTLTYPLPELVGSVALRQGGGVILAMQTGIFEFDSKTGALTLIGAPDESCSNQRFNDGRCDRQGRFWSGTMDDVDRGSVGTLYRLERGVITPVVNSLTIPNALCWSPDGRTMYFSDTTSRSMLAYRFDTGTGTPSSPRVFATVAPPGTPDGSTVDEQGYVWNAEYDNWRVTRYRPDGVVDRVLPMPVQRPTCCCFGGKDLATLFVTTAAQKLDDHELQRQPLAGRMLALDVGVRGLPEPVYIRH
tara:strand:- start:20389 stop:21255 length:867 start_codon:yes stop_codon:yes gene_type:complete